MIKHIVFYIVLGFIFLALCIAVIKLTLPNDKVTSPKSDKNVEIPIKETTIVGYKDELECWVQDNSWQKIDGCSEVRQKKYDELNMIEAAKPLLSLVTTNYVANYPNTYVSEKYNYSISYPDSWYIEESEVEGIQNITLRKYDFDYSNDDPNNYKYPLEIIIGHGQSYSTSGALCANQYCNPGGTAMLPWLNSQINIVRGSTVIENKDGIPYDTKLNFYRFSFELNGLEQQYIYALATFFTVEEGTEILDILNTLKY